MCKDCAARAQLAREAFLKAKIGEAIGHVAKGAAELAGIKYKSGLSELTAKQKKTISKPRNRQ